MLLLSVSALTCLVFGCAVFAMPKALNHLKNESEALIGLEPGAGRLNQGVLKISPFLLRAVSILFALSCVWFSYQLYIYLGD